MNIHAKLKIGLFIALSAITLNAQAEYYIAYGVPVAIVECDTCSAPRVVGAPYRSHHDYKAEKYIKSSRPVNTYSIRVYPVILMGPAYSCGAVWVPAPCDSCYRPSPCSSAQPAEYYSESYVRNSGSGEQYIANNDNYGPDLDRATADDNPSIYPGMDIDN